MKLGFSVTLDGSLEFVTIEVLKDDAHLMAHDFDAQELDQLIEVLGRARMGLSDIVPEKLDPGSIIPSIESQRIIVRQGKTPGNVALFARHPAFGWLGFELTKRLAKDLKAALRPF